MSHVYKLTGERAQPTSPAISFIDRPSLLSLRASSCSFVFTTENRIGTASDGKRAAGLEPATFGLETPCSAN
jgi:hypothetical protein